MKVTDKAKKALDIANRLSKSMHYNYVGTEHILAGLLKEGKNELVIFETDSSTALTATFTDAPEL